MTTKGHGRSAARERWVRPPPRAHERVDHHEESLRRDRPHRPVARHHRRRQLAAGGAVQWNLVQWIFTQSGTQTVDNLGERIVYIVVGVGGVLAIPMLAASLARARSRSTEHTAHDSPDRYVETDDTAYYLGAPKNRREATRESRPLRAAESEPLRAEQSEPLRAPAGLPAQAVAGRRLVVDVLEDIRHQPPATLHPAPPVACGPPPAPGAPTLPPGRRTLSAGRTPPPGRSGSPHSAGREVESGPATAGAPNAERRRVRHAAWRAPHAGPWR